jgi:5-methylthioadenosine/S-adenosylhomocysteine deaminase
MREPALSLIEGGHVLSSEGWLSPGYLTVRGKTIELVGSGDPPDELRRAANRTFNATHHAVMPGFVNGHTHLSQTFMRGLASGRPLLAWLREVIWPMQNAMTVEDMRLAALLGSVENLLGGVTTIVDHHKICSSYEHTQAVCNTAESLGLRLVLARAWADRGAHAEEPERIMDELESLFELYDGSPYVQIANGPLTPWRCSAETLQRTHSLALRHGAPTHIHVSETEEEVQKTVDEAGVGPVEWLDELGVLGQETQLVHGVWLQSLEINRLADRGAMVVHCPVSNAVLGSGFAPVLALREAGIKLRLGTDGPASNDTQDPFDTMKLTLGLARALARDPMKVSPADVLYWATDARVLTPGAQADIILVNLDTPRASPVHDPASALVLSACAADVETVFVDGEIVVEQRQVRGIDQSELLNECRRAAAALMKRAGLN